MIAFFSSVYSLFSAYRLILYTLPPSAAGTWRCSLSRVNSDLIPLFSFTTSSICCSRMCLFWRTTCQYASPRPRWLLLIISARFSLSSACIWLSSDIATSFTLLAAANCSDCVHSLVYAPPARRPLRVPPPAPGCAASAPRSSSAAPRTPRRVAAPRRSPSPAPHTPRTPPRAAPGRARVSAARSSCPAPRSPSAAPRCRHAPPPARPAARPAAPCPGRSTLAAAARAHQRLALLHLLLQRPLPLPRRAHLPAVTRIHGGADAVGLGDRHEVLVAERLPLGGRRAPTS